MKSLKQLLDDKKTTDLPAGRQARNKFISREFQDYGVRLAEELGDTAHKSLYIKLAKITDRALLESAKSFVIDSNADKKGALFMWKLKQLKKPTGVK